MKTLLGALGSANNCLRAWTATVDAKLTPKLLVRAFFTAGTAADFSAKSRVISPRFSE